MLIPSFLTAFFFLLFSFAAESGWRGGHEKRVGLDCLPFRVLVYAVSFGVIIGQVC